MTSREWFPEIFIDNRRAQLSAIMRAYITILGVGRADEAERLFKEHPLPIADTTLERLRVYDRPARSINAPSGHETDR